MQKHSMAIKISRKKYTSSEKMLELKSELIIENAHTCETVFADKLPVFTAADVIGGEEFDFIDESDMKSDIEADVAIRKARVASSLEVDSSDIRKQPLSEERGFTKHNSGVPQKRIKCNQCDRKFIKQFLYVAHVQSEHEGHEKPFQCTLCDMNFRMYYYLRRHLRETHAAAVVSESTTNNSKKKSRNSFQNECKICYKIFKRKEHLKGHHQSVHLGVRPFKCSSCEKSFATRKTCRVHEMGHSGEMPYICDKCDKAFRQKSELKIHLEIHTENKDLLCPICKRMKRSREELNAHIECHNATQQHQCPKCGRIFKKMSHLNEHDRAVHLKLRPYKCSYCKLSFALAKTCRTHERTHTGERPEICLICGQAFKQKSVLSNHIKRYHTGYHTSIKSLNY